MSAAHLRKLLLDQQPLVAAANRSRSVKIRYRVNDDKPPDDPAVVFWSVEDGFDPETSPMVKPLDVTQDQLLARRVMVYEGHDVTVKDLIRHAAHVRGAVHVGTPNDEQEEALSKLASELNVGGYQGGTRILQAIGRVVVRGLAPLEAAIRNDV
jgi:hypothetical protein